MFTLNTGPNARYKGLASRPSERASTTGTIMVVVVALEAT